MKLVVGLGNPGNKYVLNRHNIGFLALDELKIRISDFQSPISNENDWNKSKNANALHISFKFSDNVVELIKPQTFMNKSGLSVFYAARKHKISNDNIYVVHDDLDIPLGEYKIIKGKGPKEHNGLLDIYEKLGTNDFWHVRVGVDNREKDNRIPGERYVLMNFSEQEMVIVEGVIKKVAGRLIEMLLEEKY